MKKCLILLAFLPCSVSLFAQWKWLNPKPSGIPNNKIVFTDSNNGLLLNDNGDLFKTTNQGTDWQFYKKFPSPSQMELHDSTGVIIGNSSVDISTDNGLTWVTRNVPASGSIKRVDIISRDTIFLLAYTSQSVLSTLIISTDRGQNWSSINTPLNFNNKAFDFADSKTGYATGWSGVSTNYGVFKTVDGGFTWQLVHAITSTVDINFIKFYDIRFGFIYRDIGVLLRTSDGGSTWTVSNGVNHKINSMAFVNRDTIYGAGEYGVLFKTIDGGLNWTWLATSQALIYAHDFYSAYFFDEKTGFVTGFRGRILKTTDGGVTWEQHSPFYEDITALSMANSVTGFASNGINIYKTTDAGETWSFKFSIGTGWAQSRQFNNSIFFNADTGFFTATYNAHIYKTFDGGNTWNVIYPAGASYEYVAGMSFINSKVGYISLRTSSAYGLFKTTDGGESWNEIGSYHNLYKLHFINENTGYATHLQKVFKTTDGGQTWNEILSTDYDLNSIFFINAAKGFAVGDQAHLLSTLDSGRTWQRFQFENFYDDIYSVRFVNEMIGFITADRGFMFKTVDGGLTWQKDGPNSFYIYPEIEFTSDSTVYIGGSYGSLLKNKISEFRIDSVKAGDITGCRALISAKVIAAMSKVDSIWVEFGQTVSDNIRLSTPGSAVDTIINTGVTLTNLSPGTTYSARFKIFNGGAYYYSNTITFSTIAQPIPVITATNNILSSSATTGNQWYLDGNLIPGAVSQQFQATTPGVYTVKVTDGDCPGIFSAGYNFTITRTDDPVLNRELRIYPNPGNNELTIDNDRLRSLSVQLSDVNGKVLFTTNIRQRRESISIKHLAAGIYFVKVTDLMTKKMITRQILKL